MRNSWKQSPQTLSLTEHRNYSHGFVWLNTSSIVGFWNCFINNFYFQGYQYNMQPDTEQLRPEAETYNPDRRPPNLDLVKKHAASQRFGENRIFEGESDRCPCCGLPTFVDELEICCSRRDFSFNGPGIQQYFDFIIFCIYLLLIYGIIAGIFNLVMNALGDRCDVQNAKAYTPEFRCNTNFYNFFSLTNRTDSLNVISSGLNLAASFFIMVATVFYRRFVKKITQQVDDEEVNAQDFSVLVCDLPHDATEKEIFQFFTRDTKKYKAFFELKKICLGYNLEPYLKLQSEKQKKEFRLTDLLNKKSLAKQQEKGQLVEEIEQLDQQIESMEENLQSMLVFSGGCVLSYNTAAQAQAIVEHYQISYLQAFAIRFLNIFKIEHHKQFRQTILTVEKAPSPGDVLWENLGATKFERTFRRFVTTITCVVLLSLCFVLILIIQLIVRTVNKSNSNPDTPFTIQAAITLLGVVASLLIALINTCLTYVIRFFVRIERQPTQTQFSISIAKKLGMAQFLNTAIITLLVHLIERDKKISTACWQIGGINSAITIIFITNTVLPSLLTAFNPEYLWKMFKRKQIMIQGDNCNYTQKQANSYFEGTMMDPALRYAQITKTIMLAFFYAYLLPLGVLFAIVGLSIQFWVEKYLLLRRDTKPPPVSHELAEEMISFFVEMMIALLAIGCTIWEQVAYESQPHALTIVQLVLSLVYYVLPIDLIFKCCLDVEAGDTLNTYEEKRNVFWDDYDRRNPVTMQRAIEEWMHGKEEMVVSKFMLQQQRKYQSRQTNYLPTLVRRATTKFIAEIVQKKPEKPTEENMLAARRINQIVPEIVAEESTPVIRRIDSDN